MAFSSAKEIEAIADKFSECADATHLRLMAAIKNHEIDRGIAQSISENENLLRQRANRLYLDAAICVVHTLSQPQMNIVDIVDRAKEKISSIQEIKKAIGLITELIALVAAVHAAEPGLIINALKTVETNMDTLESSFYDRGSIPA